MSIKHLFYPISLILLLLPLLFPASLLAADNTNVIEYYQESTSVPSQEAWLDNAFKNVPLSALDVLVDVKNMPAEMLQPGYTGTLNWIPGGALGTTTNLIASLYSPPASGIEYLADLWHGKFLGKPAYAQGIGFKGLQPILPLWRGFRNAVYLLSSIVFVIIGIMIILRVKISPQAVVTIQNAIPQLITTLILVTFSYAIAGLLIDLMQLFQSIAIALLFSMEGKSNLAGNLLSGTPLVDNFSFSGLSTGGMGTIANLTRRAVPLAPFMVWGTIIGAIIGFFLAGGPINPITGAVAAGIVGTLGAVIVVLALAITMLVLMFKFYFGCLKCYVTAIFKIILSPLEIGIGAFPGSKSGFTNWFVSLLANLAVFPISMIFLIVANLIIDKASYGLWTPDILTNASLQSVVVGGFTLGNFVGVGIGITTIAIMSQLPTLIPQVIFSIKPSAWTEAAGNAFKLPQALSSVATSLGIGYGFRLANKGIHLAGKAGEDLYNDHKIGKSTRNAINKLTNIEGSLDELESQLEGAKVYTPPIAGTKPKKK